MKTFLLTILGVLAISTIAFAQADVPVSGIVKDAAGNIRNVQYAFINPSTATTTTIVSALSAGQKIRVLSALCVPTLANNLTFASASNAISALWPLAAGQVLYLPFTPHGWFQTNAAEALGLVTSASTATGCSVTWIATN